MKIVVYPDPVLLKKADPIPDVKDEKIQQLIDDMIDTMYDSQGVGLAAPQVGISKQLIIVNPTYEDGKEKAYINPKIIQRKGRVLEEEGCLSFPGIYGNVMRASWIKMTATLRDGTEITLEAEDFAARVLQHEIDHLNGLIFVNKFQPAEKVHLKKKLKKLKEIYDKENQ